MPDEIPVQAPVLAADRRGAPGGILTVVFLYVVFASLWILTTDKAVEWLFAGHARVALASTLKGLGFVFVTSLLLYGLMKRMMGQSGEASVREQASQAEKLRALQLLDAIAEGSADAIFAKDKDGRYLLFNREAARVTGKSTREVLGRTDVVIFPPEQAALIMANDLLVMAENRSVTFQENVTTVDGEISFLAIKVPLQDPSGQVIGMFGISRDITQLKRAERERELTVEFLHQMNESRSKEAMVRAATAFFQERSGCEAVGIRLAEGEDYPYYETRGFPVEFVRSEGSLCARGPQGEVLRDGSGYPTLACMCGNVIRGRFDPSKPFFTKNGSFWTNGTTQLLATSTDADRLARMRNRCNGEGYESVALIPLCVGEDRLGLLQLNDSREGRFSPEDIELWERLAGYLTVALAKFHAETSLCESEAQFKAMFELASIGMAQADPESGRFLRVNRKMCEITGYAPDEMIAMHVPEITHPDDRERDWQAFRNVVSGKSQEYRLEKRYIRKDGSAVWVNVNVTVIRNAGGQAMRTLATVEDISERKYMEEERVQAEAQLRQAQKMEALGTLAGGIAHDFNNILGIIFGYSEMAQTDAEDPMLVREYLAEVLKGAERAKGLVQQILAFSRRGEQEKQPMQIGLIVKEVLKMLRASLPSTIEIRRDVASRAAVLADPTQIHQVLMNLCTNAAQAMGGDVGILQVSLVDVELGSERSPVLSQLRPGPYVRLAVQDSGPGIEPAIIDRIFDPFFTTKEPGAGTGLGLSVVHGIVKSHGGAILLESAPGEGARFELFFPAVQAALRIAAVEAGPLPGGRERILVVDDEPALANAAKQMLERLGYRVECRTNGLEALEAVRDRSGDAPFDLVITDMTMPHLTGVDLARELGRLEPHPAVLLCTGFSEMIDPEATKDLGVQGFLMKPVVLKDLATMVRQVLDEGKA